MADQLQKRPTEQPVKMQEKAEQTPLYAPDVDIFEREDAYVIVADVPGVDRDSVEIDLDRNVLTLRAHLATGAPEGYELTYREYRSGDFERVFTLGNEIDRDAVEASIRDGVLRLTLPKVTEAKPRKITVQAG
ncbi:MAG: Hsp20/alpha crystallin family protein [Kiritimatiellaeota bacterium]|nr:Hsp20/alpha crystallin family protein [Kiritimatiellota bacterium]